MRNKERLIEDYKNLTNDVQKGAERGFAFEKLVNELLEIEGLNPSFPYRTDSEQIDGMFEAKGRYFHIECKWEEKPLPVSSIYPLQGKLSGKLIGSLGVFISMSDFSSGAPTALEKGKSINTLLFTRDDMDWIFSKEYTFLDVLNAKLRYAALYGNIMYRFTSHLKLVKVNKAK